MPYPIRPLAAVATWLALACSSPATTPATSGAVDASADTDSATNSKSDTSLDAGDAAVGPPCAATPVNSSGLGKPCNKPEDCYGQDAVTCLNNLGNGAPHFCAQYCFGMPNECGDGGVCVPRGPKEPKVCMPVQCAATYSIDIPDGATCTQPCNSGSVNNFGVGKPCTTMSDCAGNLAAKTCPVAIRPDAPAWCSMLCTDDSECGDNALCWRRKTVEYGVEFVIGSCAPAICCNKPK